MSKLKKISFLVIVALFASTQAHATLDLAKLYKSTFGTDEKPKCTTCHVDKLPKKDDGKHELNDYGKKLNENKPQGQDAVDEATLKKVGQNEHAEF